MPERNGDIARAFDEIADLLELQDANPFRVRAYRNAARTVGGLGIDLAAAVRRGRPLPKMRGIGDDLAAKIADIARTGSTALLARLRKQFPPGIGAVLQVPGLGPKRAHALYRELGVASLEQLLGAARAGKIRALPGFGARSEAALREAAEARLPKSRRYTLAEAEPQAKALLAALRRAPGVASVEAAGSLRRRRETVGDIDLLAVAADPGPVMERFARYPEVREVLSRGSTRSSVVLRSGIQVDLRVVPAASRGAALVYFTGSKPHNIALRRIAQAKGLKLNEYGVYRGRRRIAGETEESVYASLGLAWIPPQRREEDGELEAARAGGR